MLKVKNFLMLGLLTVALALFVPACSESEDEPPAPPPTEETDSTGYAISINGGTMEWWYDTTSRDSTSRLENGDTLYHNDVVIILSAEAPEDSVFVQWNVTPASAVGGFLDRYDPYTTFRMPASNVVITAVFGPDSSIVVEPEGYTISTIGGDMWFLGTREELEALLESFTEEQIEELLSSAPLSNGSILYEDDAVLVLSAEAPEGKEFARWNVTPVSAEANFVLPLTEPINAFIMPDADVVITAVFEDVDTTGYAISIEGGTMEWREDIDDPTTAVPLNNGDILYKHDIVLILSADPPAGKKEFDRWDVVPASAAVYFYDRYDPYTTFRMPASDVVITAVFKDFEPGKAEVRFTWEAAENERITHISASVEDVQWWYDEVYADLENSDADFTAIPLNDGNPGVTEKIFEFGSATHPYKAKYWKTEAGEFTATCGVEDEYGLAEIVANYTVTINPATATADGKDLYFEIAFDVGTFLSDDGTDDNAWFQEETDDSTKAPSLEKKKAYKVGVTRVATKQYKKPGATIDVTYYVIRRPKV